MSERDYLVAKAARMPKPPHVTPSLEQIEARGARQAKDAAALRRQLWDSKTQRYSKKRPGEPQWVYDRRTGG